MAARDLEEAKKAYEMQDIEASKRAHDAPAAKEKHKEGAEFLKSFIFGSMDGIVTTFSIVSGAVGANLSPQVVVILGVANLVGDALSMAFGDYLSTKSEIEFTKAERRREQWEVDHNPEGEMQEMEELYMAKGISQDDAKLLSNTLAKNKKVWVDVMMVEELGILEEDASPIKNGLVTFFSFIVVGIFPLLPFIIGHSSGTSAHTLFYITIALTALALFLLGASKVRFSNRGVIKSALETLFVGGAAAGVAFLIGYLLEPLAK